MTGILYLIAIPVNDFLKVIPYINPMASATYCIFNVIIDSQNTGDPYYKDTDITMYLVALFCQGLVFFMIVVGIDMKM
jgi:hypothetical protein